MGEKFPRESSLSGDAESTKPYTKQEDAGIIMVEMTWRAVNSMYIFDCLLASTAIFIPAFFYTRFYSMRRY